MNKDFVEMKRILLLIEEHNQHDRSLLMGLGRSSKLFGEWLFYGKQDLRSFTSNGVDWDELYNDIKRHKIDAILAKRPLCSEHLAKYGVPVIIFPGESKELPHLPAIICDTEVEGKLAAEHFIERGFRNYAFCSCCSQSWYNARGKHFYDNIKHVSDNFSFYEPPNCQDMDWGQKRLHLAKWIAQLPKPVAILASNDCRARLITSICVELGIKVPSEISILGIENDLSYCAISSPNLSSIQIDVAKSGHKTAVLLASLMAGEPMNGQRITNYPSRVITRESTDFVAINDPLVSEAMVFIKKNARHSIQVQDIADAVGISRWLLARKFREVLGSSIIKQLNHSRVELIKRMIDDGSSISNIAKYVKFTDENHIARLFKRETGITPKEYRQKVREICCWDIFE